MAVYAGMTAGGSSRGLPTSVHVIKYQQWKRFLPGTFGRMLERKNAVNH